MRLSGVSPQTWLDESHPWVDVIIETRSKPYSRYTGLTDVAPYGFHCFASSTVKSDYKCDHKQILCQIRNTCRESRFAQVQSSLIYQNYRINRKAKFRKNVWIFLFPMRLIIIYMRIQNPGVRIQNESQSLCCIP